MYDCGHFPECGGCQFKFHDWHNYRQTKLKYLDKITHTFPDCEKRELFISPLYSRRRVNFHVSHNKIGFFSSNSNKLVAIDNCVVIKPEILDFKNQFQELLNRHNLSGLSLVKVTLTSDQQLDILITIKKLSPSTAEILKEFAANEANIVRLFAKDKDDVLIELYQQSIPHISAAGKAVSLPVNCFLQPTQESLEYMQAIIAKSLENCSKIIDLFSGLGTFSLPLLSGSKKIRAIDITTQALASFQNSCSEVKSTEITTQVQDLYKQPITSEEISQYEGCLINPPRKGALSQAKQLADSSLSKICMISCNPQTFLRDAKIITQNRYKLDKLYPIDQFLFTSHLEVVGVFTPAK